MVESRLSRFEVVTQTDPVVVSALDVEHASSARPAALRTPGRLAEFLLVGGATPLLFPLAWLLRKSVGLDAADLAVGFVAFHAAYVVNDPHFSVTYLLFYRDARRRAFGDAFVGAQRARWWIAGVVVPVVLFAWASAALALHSAPLLGAMLQLMFFLVGWHYVKQGFGVLAVLSARRGYAYGRVERTALLVHCFVGWAYAWASPFDPGREVEEHGVVYTTLRHPHGLEQVTGIVFALSTVGLVAVLVRSRVREGRFPPLEPLAALLVSVWAWTVYSSADPLVVYVVPALHSIQYLYFVWLLRGNEARSREGPPSFGKPAAVRLAGLAIAALGLGWLLFHGAPGVLDDVLVARGKSHFETSDPLGATPFAAAFFAFVNIHHYFLDHVIWRRENPETRHLRA